MTASSAFTLASIISCGFSTTRPYPQKRLSPSRLQECLRIPTGGIYYVVLTSSYHLLSHNYRSSLTMLFQDDTGGLEVEDVHKPGTFIAATPLKNALIMNVGDLLMRWSNGSFSADPLFTPTIILYPFH